MQKITAANTSPFRVAFLGLGNGRCGVEAMLFDVADDPIRQLYSLSRQLLVLRIGKPPAVGLNVTVQPPRCPHLDVSLAKGMQRKLVAKVGQQCRCVLQEQLAPQCPDGPLQRC